MKVNIKGLVFTGFAAAILSANAMAAGENVVTSKSFTEHTYQHKSTGASIGNDSGTWTPLDVTVPEENASSSTAPTTAAVRAALNAVDSARTYNSGTNINIDAQNNINAVASDIANGATTLVTGGTVYTALLDEQDKNTTDKYEVNKNGVWTDIGDAVSGDTNYIGVTANDSTGALTVSALTTAVADSATGLATAQGVYDYVQGITNGNNIPAQDPRKCTATIQCALVAINNNGNMEQHWYTMATDSHAGGVLADAQ